jgi:hypothetical protein
MGYAEEQEKVQHHGGKDEDGADHSESLLPKMYKNIMIVHQTATIYTKMKG